MKTATFLRRQRAPSASLALAVISLTWLPAGAYATTYKVYSPTVEYGETEIEARAYVNQDNDEEVDNSGAFKIAYGHAFTDFWMSEVYAEVEHEENTTTLEAIEWENLFQLTPRGKYWADFGLLAELELATRSGHPHAFKIGPLIEKSFGRAVATVNLFLEREFGPNRSDETEFSYAARLRWRLDPQFEPAIEIYGAPGAVDDFATSDEQRHQIGPGFYGETNLGGAQKLQYSSAVLYGITDE
ncbi:MAG: hypothetical protein L0H83_09075, partial [Salinisphaera sp.]|nr:hypothetical protein [Salinisphaera sp.]